MARPLRIEYEDAVYHICARGNARERIFQTDLDRPRFLQLLEQSAQRFILLFMPRPLRIQYEGARYHVMSRGDRREPIFHDDNRNPI